MSLTNWFTNTFMESQTVTEEAQPEVVIESEEVQFQMDSVYPLIVDPTLDEVTERFAIIRTRLLNANSQSNVRSVIVSSAQEGEGKSMACANLAISFGQLAKQSVLLVDADLRIGGVTHLLRMGGTTGVMDFLTEDASFQDCVHRTNYPNVCVAPCGREKPGALPAALEGSRWPEFLEAAKQKFDFIIVDSVPAAAPIADFEILSSACDKVLLVVQLHKSKRDVLNKLVQQLNSRLVGVVLNNSSKKDQHDYLKYYKGKYRRA